jgi:hypothetical protein
VNCLVLTACGSQALHRPRELGEPEAPVPAGDPAAEAADGLSEAGIARDLGQQRGRSEPTGWWW